VKERSPIALASVALATTLGGCYLMHERPGSIDAADRDAAITDAPLEDAPRTMPDAAPERPDAYAYPDAVPDDVPPRCAWSVGPTTRLTPSPGWNALSLLDATLADDAVLVAWSGYGHRGDASAQLQAIGFDGSLTSTPITHPTPDIQDQGTGSIAVSGTERAWAASSAIVNCRFVRLDASNTPVDYGVTLGPFECDMLAPAPGRLVAARAERWIASRRSIPAPR